MNTKTAKGFTWLLITDKVKEVFNSGCFEIYALHDDNSEALINNHIELILAQEEGLQFGIEVGRVAVTPDWAETHYEIIRMVQSDVDNENSDTIAYMQLGKNGIGSIYEICYDLTNDFMKKYEDENWGETADWLDTLESFYEQNRLVKGHEGELFYRKCSFTGNGMLEGFCFNMGEVYASTQELADQHAVSLGYTSFKDMFNKGGECYWTSWVGLAYYEFVVKNGVLKELKTNS